jgi:hypothetical protein
LNRRHRDFQSRALPTELPGHKEPGGSEGARFWQDRGRESRVRRLRAARAFSAGPAGVLVAPALNPLPHRVCPSRRRPDVDGLRRFCQSGWSLSTAIAKPPLRENRRGPLLARRLQTRPGLLETAAGLLQTRPGRLETSGGLLQTSAGLFLTRPGLLPPREVCSWPLQVWSRPPEVCSRPAEVSSRPGEVCSRPARVCSVSCCRAP